MIKLNEIKNITKQNDCEIWEIETSNDLMKFFAHKGSVSLNGVSLTINYELNQYTIITSLL